MRIAVLIAGALVCAATPAIAQGVASCSGAGQALQYNTTTHGYVCNSAIDAATLAGTASYSGVGSCPAHQWTSALSTKAAPSCTQLGYQDLSSGATVDLPLTGSGLTASHIGCQAASGSQAGCLSSTDWTTFNNKQAAGSYLTTVTADSPLSGSGTAGSHLVIQNADSTHTGALTSGDWSTFNGKIGSITGGAAVANQWVNSISGGGAATLSRPAFSDISGTASTAQIPNHDAGKITTGTLTQAVGGTGAGPLTCANGEFITSDGAAYKCLSILTGGGPAAPASGPPLRPAAIALAQLARPAAFVLPCNAVRRLNCR